MGHDIRAFADKDLKVEIAYLRLFPTQAFHDGNIYAVLTATEFRNSCSGSGGVAEFKLGSNHEYHVEPNKDSQKFLDDINRKIHEMRGPTPEMIFVKFS